MLERISEQQTAAGDAGDARVLEQLRLQIETHVKEDGSRSVLKRAVGSVSSVFVKDDASLEELRDVYRQQQQNFKDGKALDTAAIRAAIESDREAAYLQTEVVHYGSQFLKTAGLFMRGRIGLAGTIGLYALDQIRPGDSFKEQLADAALGAAKGSLMKGAFHVMGTKPVGGAAKGLGLGVSSRVLELGLTRQTYVDAHTGEFSLGRGLSATLLGAFNKPALAADVVIFGAAHGLLRGANSASFGRIDQSPMLTTIFTGTTFGLSAGATGEIMRQNAAGEQFDLGKIVKRSLIQGALDTVAAVPGGVQADPHVQGRIQDYARSGVDKMRAEVSALKTSVQQIADSIPLDLHGGMVAAVAGGPGIRLLGQSVRPEHASRPARDTKLDGTSAMAEAPKGTGAGGSGGGFDGADGGRHPIAGGRRLEPQAAIRRFEQLAPGIDASGRRATLEDHLRTHPEIEGAVRQHARKLYDSITTNFKPGELTAGEIAWRVRVVQVVEQFYKSDHPSIPVENTQQWHALNQFTILILPALKTQTVDVALKTLSDFIARNPAVREHVKQYGAATNLEPVVRVLDRYFGTENLKSLNELAAWRRQRAPVTSEGAQVGGDSEPGTLAGKHAVVESKPATGSADPGYRSAEQRNRSAEQRYRSAEERYRSDEERYRSAVQAVDNVVDMSDAEFRSWQKNLTYPASRMDPQSLRLLIAGPHTPQSAIPDWAKSHGESGRAFGALVADSYVEAAKRPERSIDTPRGRLALVERATSIDRYDHSYLEIGRRGRALGKSLVEKLAGQPETLRELSYRAVQHSTGGAYSQLFAMAAPHARSAEPLVYLAKFLREGNVEGAMAAVEQMMPPKREASESSPSSLSRDADPRYFLETTHDLIKIIVYTPRLDRVTDAQFLEWVAAAKHRLRGVSELQHSDIRALRTDVVRRLVAEDDAVQTARSGVGSRDFTARIHFLKHFLEKFRDAPEAGRRLAELGVEDKPALATTYRLLGDNVYGEANRQLVLLTIDKLTTLEPLKRLFESLERHDVDGALAAARDARPDLATNNASVHWQQIERLIRDIAGKNTSSLPSPSRPYSDSYDSRWVRDSAPSAVRSLSRFG